jgi:hypothetical protein
MLRLSTFGHFTEVLRRKPEFAESHNNYGIAMIQRRGNGFGLKRISHGSEIKAGL